MDEDLRKYFGVLLVFLEIILAGCLVLLAFIYGIWVESFSYSAETTVKPWIIEGLKRQLIITTTGVMASWLIHTTNLYWIEKTGQGSGRNSLIFSIGLFILVFLSGLAGVMIFIMQNPVSG